MLGLASEVGPVVGYGRFGPIGRIKRRTGKRIRNPFDCQFVERRKIFAFYVARCCQI